MARKARIKSSTGIYHVLVRAIADLPLFTDEEDTTFYTNILNDLQHQGRCEVYAYALFPTHVHILLRDSSLSPSGELVGGLMKRLASAYSYFFNVKYDHYGPIYLDRFKSNPVETRGYFLRVLNHIGTQDTPWKFTCRHIPSGLPKESSSSACGEPVEPSSLLDFKPRPVRITDSKLLDYLQTNFQFTNIGEFLQRPDEDIKATISSCKKLGGSIRQIVRLTGTPYQSVFQIK